MKLYQLILIDLAIIMVAVLLVGYYDFKRELTPSSGTATWTLNRWDPDDPTLLRSRQTFTCRQGDHVVVAGDNFVKTHDCVPRTDVTVDVRGAEFNLKSTRKP